eukprot:1153289-Pelagomonas_calceolata.AAC.1
MPAYTAHPEGLYTEPRMTLATHSEIRGQAQQFGTQFREPRHARNRKDAQAVRACCLLRKR